MQSSSLNKNSSQGAQAILNFYRKTEDTISKTYFWLLNVYNVESERRENHGEDYYEKRGRCRQWVKFVVVSKWALWLGRLEEAQKQEMMFSLLSYYQKCKAT